MLRNNYLWCFVGITAYLVSRIAAREAIVGGHVARQHDFPYVVSVQVGGQHICGGTIIHEEFALTAARCLVDDQLQAKYFVIYVVAGTSNLRERDYPAVTLKVSEIYVPKAYNPTAGALDGNIAVLKISEGFKLEHRLRNLREAVVPKKGLEIRPGELGKIAGFGWNVAHRSHSLRTGLHGHGDNRLHSAEATILNQTRCNDIHKNHRILRDNEFCAQIVQHNDDQQHGTCEGDEGSPLIDVYLTVIGVLIDGPYDCSERNASGIYVNIMHYSEMIKRILEKRPHAHEVNLLNLQV